MTALVDAVARERFRDEWDQNFAVSANAGSGKTTAISQRLAAMARDPVAREHLARTAVVTYTNKAAGEIGARTRDVLWRNLAESGAEDFAALEALAGVTFGTIHSFCLQLAQRHGATAGMSFQAELVDAEDEEVWERFMADVPLEFPNLEDTMIDAYLRHGSWEAVFELARRLTAAECSRLRQRGLTRLVAVPDPAGLDRLRNLDPGGRGGANKRRTQERAEAWQAQWQDGARFLPLFEPSGSAQAVVEAVDEWMRPLQIWLGEAGGVLAAELSDRFREWRQEQGLQTYADQVEMAMRVLEDDQRLNAVRAEGWRVLLDEAQDTDPAQFRILVEIARPVGSGFGDWPPTSRGSTCSPPRAGHFSLVGDGQQAIYGDRADMANFLRHVGAFARGDGGQLLEFQVTFRAPHAVIDGLNATLPDAFGESRDYNFGRPAEPGATAPKLQVKYLPLAAGPNNVAGRLERLELDPPADSGGWKVADWMSEEARQVSALLREIGRTGLGVDSWSEVAILAPRNDWLEAAKREFELAGWEVALQSNRVRRGDRPVFAWLSGLMAVMVDPEDGFEWVGVLRDVMGLSDACIGVEMQAKGRIHWEEPDEHRQEMAEALSRLRPLIMGVDDAGWPLSRFVAELIRVTDLRAKAQRVDPNGGASRDLDGLLAEAADLGVEGVGPREWEAHLRRTADQGKPMGQPGADSINLLTCHSAKGLEWRVVIPLGMWRGIGSPAARGLRLMRGEEGELRTYWSSRTVPEDTAEARERERWRELTRLLYVTLTRARDRLVIPWCPGFGGRGRAGDPSFAELWGVELTHWPLLEAAPRTASPNRGENAPMGTQPAAARLIPGASVSRVQTEDALPARLLPHRLGKGADQVRLSRHETGDLDLAEAGNEEAIVYGLWWHETVEFYPWEAAREQQGAFWENRYRLAEESGFADRAEEEWNRFKASRCWNDLVAPRWRREAEMAVLAPLPDRGWIDGVVDLVLWDQQARELWVVDWKTNRRRRGEDVLAMEARLGEQYAPQLQAYGECLAPFFEAVRCRLLIYPTALGCWLDL